jgi:hypothetical protein
MVWNVSNREGFVVSNEEVAFELKEDVDERAVVHPVADQTHCSVCQVQNVVAVMVRIFFKSGLVDEVQELQLPRFFIQPKHFLIHEVAFVAPDLQQVAASVLFS